MKVSSNSGNKKLIASAILFVASLVLWVLTVYFLFTILFSSSEMTSIVVCIPCAICYFIFIIASILLNLSYRKHRRNTFSAVLLIASSLLVMGIIGVALGCLVVYKSEPVEEAETLKGKDEDGKEYILKPASRYGSDCIDQYGDTWQTFNYGRTYERKPKVKDEEGNEYILTKYSETGNLYTDQHGHWWRTEDGGKTFNKD